MNVTHSKQADLIIRNVNGEKLKIESFDRIIKALANISTITIGKDLEKPEQSATAIVKKMELFVPIKGLINLEQEINRLSKRSNDLKTYMLGVENKLANESFINKAQKNVEDNEKKKLNEMNEEFELIKTNLDMLK